MRIFLITLRGSPRLQPQLDHFRSFGLEPEVIFYGVKGRELERNLVEKICLKTKIFRQLVLGEIGAYLTHHLAYSYIVKNQISRAFIFEDDVRFLRNPRDFLYQVSSIDFTSENFCVNLFSPDPLKVLLPVRNRIAVGEITLEQIDMPLLWLMAYHISLDFAAERLSRAFPIVRGIDVYSHLKLKSAYFTAKPEIITYAPTTPSQLGVDNLRLATRLVRKWCPRGTRARFLIDRAVDDLTYRYLARRFWQLDETVQFLAGLEQYTQ